MNQKKYLLVAILFLISACAGVGFTNQIAPEKIAEMKNIGVYSGFENKLNIYLKAAREYDDVHKEIKMPAWWNLNKSTVKTVLSKIENSKKIKTDSENLSVKEILVEAKKQKFDTAILILPSYYNDDKWFIKQGYGMARYSTTEQKGYLLFKIFVYDVASGKEISSSTGFSKGSENANFDLPLDFREYFNYHRDEVEKLLHKYQSVINSRIGFALKEMGFVKK